MKKAGRSSINYLFGYDEFMKHSESVTVAEVNSGTEGCKRTQPATIHSWVNISTICCFWPFQLFVFLNICSAETCCHIYRWLHGWTLISSHFTTDNTEAIQHTKHSKIF